MIALTTSIPHANAQITKSTRIELKEDTQSVNIGKAIFILKDAQRNLKYNTVIERYENNLLNTKTSKSVLNLGLSAPASWVVFSITNTSDTQDWVLDFGHVLDGRLGLTRKLFVRNHSTKETFFRALKDNENAKELKDNILKSAIPIKLRPKQTDIIIAYIEVEGGLPNTFKPTIKSKAHYNALLNGGAPLTNSYMFFLIGIIGFFAAFSFLRRRYDYTLFSAYFGLQTVLFTLLNSTVYAEIMFMGEILAVLFAAPTAFGILLTRDFFNITRDDDTESSTLVIAAATLILTALIHIVIFTENSILDDALIFLPVLGTQCALSIVCFKQGQDGKYGGHFMFAGWIVLFTGTLMTALSGAQILSTNTFFMNGYWIAIIFQAALFTIATSKKIQLLDQEERSLRSRENRAAASLARLQQSKEAADQARLLRVIERERELMAELREREIQRTEEMRYAKEQADIANKAKSAFLAVVSHEIRTPMTGILGIIRLMTNTKLSKEQTDYAVAIQQSGDTMMALLNDILDFEKIESGNMQLEEIEFDFPRLVQDVITLMSGHAIDKNIALKADISENFPTSLIGDPTRLRQVILNLTSNAIKFTETGSVTIILKAITLEGQPTGIDSDYEIHVGVQDTGIGIPEDVQKELFSPFSQADETVSRRYGGTGLGLAICKRLVEAMRSSIHLESKEGEGSLFFFNALMKAGRENAALIQDAVEEEKRPLSPMSILVIEDNEMNRKVIQGFLDQDKHQVVMCESGEKGLDILTRSDTLFDVIFTDIRLAGMDGLETTKTIRALPNQAVAKLPIIAVTGNISPEDVELYERTGMNGFIAKPISPEEIYKTLFAIQEPLNFETSLTHAPQQTEASAAPTPIAVEPEQAEEVEEAKGITEAEESEETESAAVAFEEQISPLQQYIKTGAPIEAPEGAPEETPPLQTAPEETAPVITEDPNFNQDMLKDLYSSLGRESFTDLLQGFLDKADEIIESLEALKGSDDTESMYDRGHELKGMAGNFGMTELSAISANIEKAAKDKNPDATIADIEKLSDANQRAKISIQNWMKTQS